MQPLHIRTWNAGASRSTTRITASACVLTLVLTCLLPAAEPLPAQADSTGINWLSPDLAAKIDRQVAQAGSYCSGISIGLVYGGRLVYTKSYGSYGISDIHEWGSVSKTATALVVMRLVERGQLSLDAPIWQYAPEYQAIIPAEYLSTPLTLRHLLTHMGGINNLGDENTPAMFVDRPGDHYHYSTNGFGIAGQVLSDTLHADYASILRTEIGGDSITAAAGFTAPGVGIESNITDLAEYLRRLMQGQIVSSGTLQNQVLKPAVANQGLGFQLAGSGNNLVAFETGGNQPRSAFMLIRPALQRGVAIFCEPTYNWGASPLQQLSQNLDTLLDMSAIPGTPGGTRLYLPFIRR